MDIDLGFDASGFFDDPFVVPEDPNNFTYVRLGKIIDSGSNGLLAPNKGFVLVRWIDHPGDQPTPVLISFPSVHHEPLKSLVPADFLAGVPALAGTVAYGFTFLPSKDDIVIVGFRSPTNPVILGYVPKNYQMQAVDGEPSRADLGALRNLVAGEFSWQSKQQVEVYLDRSGSCQIIAKAQPSIVNPLTDGSASISADSIDPTKAPTTEIARLTIGETYDDAEFTTRAVSSQSSNVIARLVTKTGAKIQIDAAGNLDIEAAPGKVVTVTGASVKVNDGTEGAARVLDTVKSSTTITNVDADTTKFWALLQAIVDGLITSTVTPLDGGATYKAGIIARIALANVASASQVPQTLTSQITTGSTTVKIG